jgi:hypothetical protein
MVRVMVVCLLLCGCAGTQVPCERHLVPINALVDGAHDRAVNTRDVTARDLHKGTP